MNAISVDELFAEFCERIRGERVRGQVVRHVEMTIDTLAELHDFRYWLAVQFEPRPNVDPLKSEEATACTYSRDVLIAWMAGDVEPEWLLADEK